MNNLTLHFFDIMDIASLLFMLLLVTCHAFWKRWKHEDKAYYRFFLPSVYFKLFIGLSFSVFYIFYYDSGGDTVAYWSGAIKLDNLFWEDPFRYINEMYSPATSITRNFSSSTGYPPTWIYSEPESWFVSKIFSLFMIVNVKGYLALTVMIAYMSALVTWRFFELIRSFNLHSDRALAFALFFIPSFCFWYAGLSKDTLIYLSLILFMYNLFQVFHGDNFFRLKHWVAIAVCAWMLYSLRPIMLFTSCVPILFAVNIRLSKIRHAQSTIVKIVISLSLLIGVVVISLFVFTNGTMFASLAPKSFINEAAIVQQDFTNNTTYGVNRYRLDVTDYSIQGLLKAFPASVIAGIYRPFIWESLIPTLILNGIESVIIMVITVRFFIRKNLKERIRLIRKNELMVYMFSVMLIVAFFSGFTSILFGVLVRIRALALPFLMVILFTEKQKRPADKNPPEISGDENEQLLPDPVLSAP